tara:strand:- start:1299 stop:2708 length:1410 start_codon:yes stop_codon:yes gene_type:complete
MATVSIDQRPLYKTLPIGQQVIFTVSNNGIVATKFKVKFVAEVRVSGTAINPNVATDLIGTFKTTPNNAGVGIFDFRPVLETFVSPDNLPTKDTGLVFSKFKGTTSANQTFPIHIIDKYSLSDKSIKFFQVRFLVEYSDTASGAVVAPTLDVDSAEYTMFNGVLQYDNILTQSVAGNDYGYNLQDFHLVDNDRKFLSNAPTTQYALLTDYGTLPFLNRLELDGVTSTINYITLTYYKADGSATAGVSDSIVNNGGSGGSALFSQANSRLIYAGVFPANLQNWSSNFALAMADDLDYYTVQAFTPTKSELYRINILCPNNKGYDPIRLTWLNQWGAWDYYTFNKRSTRSVKTKRIPYTQLGGTWNQSTFQIDDYKGGRKNFRVNSSEAIKINTDFVTEDEGVWFEEMMNSPEVYILKGFSADEPQTITNKYIEPVTVKTSTYIRKTIANDRLMQYTFEIEKTRTKRTQSV